MIEYSSAVCVYTKRNDFLATSEKKGDVCPKMSCYITRAEFLRSAYYLLATSIFLDLQEPFFVIICDIYIHMLHMSHC